MYILVCSETGLDCDFIIKGETEEKLLENGANHAIQQHGINSNDIYLENIPTNLICHSFNKLKISRK
jgi:predicted small metal-binding protein